MLPFLKPKKAASTTTVGYTGGQTKMLDETHSEDLMFAAQDLISGIHGKDAQKVASALKAFHEMNKEKEDFLASTPG